MNSSPLCFSKPSSFVPTSRRLRLPVPSSGLPSRPPSSSQLLLVSAAKAEEIHQATCLQTKTTIPPPKVNNQVEGVGQPITRRLSPPSQLRNFCNFLDELINTFMEPPVLRPSVDPTHVLSGNFAPVGELPPTPCPVVRGAIPRCLAGGAYIRNGPNPQHLPKGPHHLIDGDGMLHSFLLPADGAGGDPILSSRYVCTYKYLLERDASSPILPRTFWGFYGFAGVARCIVAIARVLTKQINLTEGIGLANTSLAFFGDRLYALGEPDLPYAMQVSPEDGEIVTMGRCDFGGNLFTGMTAHPKKDPVTGEAFAFCCSLMPPFVTYFRFDADGNKVGRDVPLFSVPKPSVLHDFAITERYAVFPDIQIVMKPMKMVLGGGAPLVLEPGKVSRIGVLPRYANSEAEMVWFQVPGLNTMHVLNAWEEGNELVLVAPNLLSVGNALDQLELVQSRMEMVRINLQGSRTPTRTPLSASNLELGVINSDYVGRKSRYAYMGVAGPMPKTAGVVKMDFTLAGAGDCVVAQRDFGPGCYGGEPFFVPKGEREVEEDEGYLMSFVYDERSKQSRFVVMDAQSPDLDIVAEVLLPRRVPYGFHGLFVSRDQLRSQRAGDISVNDISLSL